MANGFNVDFFIPNQNIDGTLKWQDPLNQKFGKVDSREISVAPNRRNRSRSIVISEQPPAEFARQTPIINPHLQRLRDTEVETNQNIEHLLRSLQDLETLGRFLKDPERPFDEIQSMLRHSPLPHQIYQHVAQYMPLSCTSADAIQENPYLLLRLKDDNGSNPIDQFCDQLKLKLAQNHAILQLVELETFAIHSTSDTHTAPQIREINNGAIQMFQALSPLAKDLFCLQIRNLCVCPEVANFGETHVLETHDFNMFGEYRGIRITERTIQQLQESSRSSVRLNMSFVHPQEIKGTDSRELMQTVQQLYQLEDFLNFLKDPGKAADAAFLSQKFEQLHTSLRKTLKGLMWIGRHQKGHREPLDPTSAPLDFAALLGAQDQTGRSLFEKILLNLNAKIVAQRKLEQFIPLLQALTQQEPPVEHQLILAEFRKLDPSIQTHLECRLYLESESKTNPHFGEPNWGRLAIEADPRCLLPIVDTEIRPLFEKTIYSIQNEFLRPWLDLQKIKAKEPSTLPSSIHQPLDMLRFTATTVKTALTAPFRLYADRVPIASTDRPYMDHELRLIAQDQDAQNLSRKVAGLLPLMKGPTFSLPALAERNITSAQWGVFEDSALPEWNFQIAERRLSLEESREQIQKYSDILHTVIEKEGLQIALPKACAIPTQPQTDEETQRKVAIFSPLLNAMQQEPAVSNEELFAQFTGLDQSIQSRLLEQLWYESGGKTDPHFGGPNWNERAVQDDPRLLIPFLEAEIQHLHNPTFFLMIDQKITGTDFRTGFCQLPLEQQRRCAEDFCRFIALTGYNRISLDTMSIVNGKIKLHDLPLHSAATIAEARVNARNALNWLTQQCSGGAFPILRIAAEEQLIMLEESALDSPETIQLYRALIKLMKESSATIEQKQTAFQRLPIELRDFLYFCVWSGLKDMVGIQDHEIGRKRLEADINILTELKNAYGMSILEQFEVRNSLTEVLNILRMTKRILSEDNVGPEALILFVGTLEKTMLGSALLAPIAQHLTQQIAAIQSLHKDLSDENLCEVIKQALVGSPGQEGILDIYIHSIDATKRQLSIKAIKHCVKMNREFASEHFPTKPAPREKIQVTQPPIPLEALPQRMRVLLVAYECAQYGLKYGGLGEAVYGMARSLTGRGCDVTVLMPKFSGLPKPLRETIERQGRSTTVRHEVSGSMKEDRVLTIDQEPSLHLAYLEDTNVACNYFDIPTASQIYEDGNRAVPHKKWHGLKERMAYLGNATAEYIVSHKDDFDAVIYNDYHAAYAIDRIAHRYFDRWVCGEFPANVFIIHNNSYGCQGVYGVEEANVLQMFGDNRAGLNVMIEAVKMADRTLTVSETFAEEMQQGGLTWGIGPWIRKSTHDGKFKGIINGSNPDLWNPSTNAVLKNWKDPITGTTIDLSYSHQTADLVAHKKQVIGKQLFKVLEKWYPDALDSLNIHSAEDFITPPFIGYVGRYDSTQKGLDKFIDVMRAAHDKGAKFIALGTGEDQEANRILDALDAEARKWGCGWITRGKDDNASLKMQLGQKADLSQGITEDIPGLGPLWRSFFDLMAVPSEFEPCGLVQTEGWLFGTLVIGTRTGGLADTIISDQAHPRFNGFTYERLHEWKSTEQSQLVYNTTAQALDYWMNLGAPEKQAMVSRLMTDGGQLSWTTSPNGISPSDRYLTLLQEAIAAKKKRHTQKTDLLGIEDNPVPERDNYFGVGQQTQLYNTFGAHIQPEGGVNFRVMAPAAQSVKVITIELNERQEPMGKETAHEMQRLEDGSWQALVSSAKEGTRYQYELVNNRGQFVRKTDPFAFGFDAKDRKICTVEASPEGYAWADSIWMANRPDLEDRPKNIYEVHISSWLKQDGGFVSYQNIAERLAKHCLEMGFTHVQLFGIFEHLVDESMGYQVSGYFAPTSRNGSLKNFQGFVDILHQNRIAVIIDFVAAHFVKDDTILRDFDGTHFFETQDLRNRYSRWGTLNFNFEREDVRNFLLSSVCFFLDECHVDGIRTDAVAELIAYSRWRSKDSWNPGPDGTEWNKSSIQFIRDMNRIARERHAITIAENSWRAEYFDTLPVDDPSGKGLGFDLRLNMKARDGAFDYFRLPAEERSRQDKKDRLRRALTNCGNQSFIGPYMSHDETKKADRGHIVHHVTSFDDTLDDVKNKVRLYHALHAFAPQHARMTAMGMEYGFDGYFDPIKGMDWDRAAKPEHCSFKEQCARINRFYLENRAFWNAGKDLNRFNWIPLSTPNAVIAYERIDPKNPNKRYLVVHNFANKRFENFLIGDREHEAIRDIKQAKIVFRSDEANERRLGNATLCDSHSSNSTKGLIISQLPKYGTVIIEQTV